MRYFAKLNLEVLPPELKPSQFEKLIRGWGHIATEDPEILAVIDRYLGKSYAFYEIKKEDYELTKKTLSESTPPNSPAKPEPPSPTPPAPRPAGQQEASVVAAATEPVPTPPPTLRRSPLVGRSTKPTETPP
jgi:hypothetical protein